MKRRNFLAMLGLGSLTTISTLATATPKATDDNHVAFDKINMDDVPVVLQEIRNAYPDAHLVFGGSVREETRSFMSVSNNNVIVRMDIEDWITKTAYQESGTKTIYIYDMIDVTLV